MAKHTVREVWLMAFVEAMRATFKAKGSPLPKSIRVEVGFTSKGHKGKRIGECWDATASKDKTVEILVRPDQEDKVTVVAIVAHELCHAALGSKAGHGRTFKQLAESIGLTGPMRATVPGPDFKTMVAPMLRDLGPYPHARLDFTKGRSEGPGKQSTRLLKVVCPACDYTVRTTRKWLDVGLPVCPCGEDMMEVDVAEIIKKIQGED
mgnify:FL=1